MNFFINKFDSNKFLCSFILWNLGIFLYILFVFIHIYFDKIDFNQFLFHIKYYEALDLKAYAPIYRQFLFYSMLYAFLMIVLYGILWKYFKSEIVFLSLFFLIFAILFVGLKLKIFQYVESYYHKSDFYEDNYRMSDNISFSERKNLIVLYLESMESIYAEGGIFGENLLPQLTSLQEENIKFGRYHQVAGSGWTVAGLVTSSCSLPLVLPIDSHSYGRNGFLPNASCLQDILKKNGYHEFFVSSGETGFAYTDVFLKSHAEDMFFADVEPNEFVWQWGNSDKNTYGKAMDLLSAKAVKNQPFFMTIMTLDMHHPGYLDEKCSGKFGDFRDVVKCADMMAADFIRWFQKQVWAKDTVLLVVGDHLAMSNPVYDQYLRNRDENRTIFNLFIDGGRKADMKRDFSGLDILPTLLKSLGADWQGNRLGLGTVLFSKQKTLLEIYGHEGLNRQLSAPSERYNAFVCKN